MNISKLLKSSLLLVAFCAGGNYSGYADLGDPVPEEPVDVPELASLSALELTNLLGANFQARINQDQADINRAAVGGTFLPDFFEPFFHVERAIDAYNEIVASFNAVYPGTTEVYKGTASTSVFEAVEKDGEFFTFVGNLRQYMSRTLVDKGERGGLLKAIYEATLKPEDPLEADVVGAFEGTIASTLGESKGLDVADMTYPTSWDQEDNFKTRFGEVVHLADGVLALGNNTLATAAAALNALFTKIQEPTQAQITNALFSVGEEPDVDYYVLDPTVIDISLVESMRRRNEELNAELDHIKHDLTTLLRMVGRIMNYTH